MSCQTIPLSQMIMVTHVSFSLISADDPVPQQEGKNQHLLYY